MQYKSYNILLEQYSKVIINTSGGKDSICAIWEICRIAEEQNYPKENIVLSYQDLSNMVWPDTKQLIIQHAKYFGLQLYITQRRTKSGKSETILDYAKRRGKWPSNKQRWCTSDFKRGPGAKVVTMLCKEGRVLYVFGFRKEESPSRKKKPVLKLNNSLTTKKRRVEEYLPIHDWPVQKVWETIKQNNIPYHWAYDVGMKRLSCMFCIFSPLSALAIAGKHNPKLLDEYIQVEEEIGHTFRQGFSIKEVKVALENGYSPETTEDWIM